MNIIWTILHSVVPPPPFFSQNILTLEKNSLTSLGKKFKKTTLQVWKKKMKKKNDIK